MPSDQSQLIDYKQIESPNSYSVDSVVTVGGQTSSLSISVDNTGTTSVQQVVRDRRPFRRHGNTPDRQPVQDHAVKDAIRRGVLRAIDTSKEMTNAARSGDLMELSNAGFDLAGRLDELWGFRDHRESNWGDLINLIQGALVREKFESFTEQQCNLIGEILAHHLRPCPVEDDDLRSSVQILRRAKFDPWKGLSKAEG